MEIIGLFPIPVGRFNIGLPGEQCQKFISSLQDRIQNIGNTTSANRTVLLEQPMLDLSNAIHDCLQEYAKGIYLYRSNTRFGITQSWLNYTEKGQHHHKHAHPGSLISGVYYVNAIEGDQIMFFKSGYQRVKFPASDYNMFNSESWWIPVRTGDLVLFPSELEHMVPTLESDHTRVSLAFNTWFDGECGEIDNLTHLSVSISGKYKHKEKDNGGKKDDPEGSPGKVRKVSGRQKDGHS